MRFGEFLCLCVVSSSVIFVPAMSASGTSAHAMSVQQSNGNRQKSPSSIPPKPFGTKARVAYYYNNEGVSHEKNVSSFTSPSTGTYCITPSVQLNFLQLYPQITIDWGNSQGNVLFAYWYAYAGDCPEGSLEVVTYNGSGNRTNGVSFDFSIG